MHLVKFQVYQITDWLDKWHFLCTRPFFVGISQLCTFCIFCTKTDLMENSFISGSNGDIDLQSSTNNLYNICNNSTAIYLSNLSFRITKINLEFKIYWVFKILNYITSEIEKNSFEYKILILMDKDICRNAPCKISGASDHIYAQVLLSEYLSPLFS